MSEEKPNESGGATETAKPVLDLENLKREIEQLAPGTKERIAWEKLGAKAQVTRVQFRDLWLAIRCPKKPKADPQAQTKAKK